jgi:hypothetical protein
MSVANLVIFLIVVAGLVLLVLQNISPSVSLVFLGTQTPSFPLSFWMVMAIAVGVILSLLIWGLFQLSASGSAAVPQSSPPPRSPKPPVQPMGFKAEPSPEPSSSYSSSRNPVNTARTSTTYSSPQPTASTASTNDDWETEVKPIRQSWDEEDWGEEESVNSTASQPRWNQEEVASNSGEPRSEASEVRSSYSPESEYTRPNHYEVEQKPKRETWSGSVYSYGYREGGDTAVGKSESVYDADYRIITPPPPSTEIQDDEEEDWDVQDDYEDEESSNQPPSKEP